LESVYVQVSNYKTSRDSCIENANNLEGYMKRKRDKIRLEKQISKKLHKKSRQRAALKIQSAWRATYPTALPKEEALQILFSPDGYYKYLGISDNHLVDRVSRNYRILSKQYTKKADTDIREVLRRVDDVLSDPSLREMYDMVGLDLEYFQTHLDPRKERNVMANWVVTINSKLWTAFKSIIQVLLTRIISDETKETKETFLVGSFVFLVDTFIRILNRKLNSSVECVLKNLALVLSCCKGQPLEFDWTFWVGETAVMCCMNQNLTGRSTHGRLILFAIISILSGWLRGSPWRYAYLLGMDVIIIILVFVGGCFLEVWTGRVVINKMVIEKTFKGETILEVLLESVIEEKMGRVREKIRKHEERTQQMLNDVRVKSLTPID